MFSSPTFEHDEVEGVVATSVLAPQHLDQEQPTGSPQTSFTDCDKKKYNFLPDLLKEF